VFGYSFLLASFVLFLVKEKESKVRYSWLQVWLILSLDRLILQAKHLQFVSGVHSSSYWLAIDLCLGSPQCSRLVPIVISIVIFAAFGVDAFSSLEALAAIFVLLVSTCYTSLVH
jgi:hypothetical protein